MDELLANYSPNESVRELVRQAPLLLLVGISGAGKDSIKKELLATGDFYDFISYTTRAPRYNNGILEKDGKEYHFVTREKMEQLLRSGDMIEAKQYSDNIYGTGAEDLREAIRANKIALNDIEVQGVAEYKRIDPNVHAVFVLPPSYTVWRDRFVARYGDGDVDEEDWQNRLVTAKTELQTALASGYYDFVINDSLDQAVEQVIACTKGNYSSDLQEQGKKVAVAILEQLD